MSDSSGLRSRSKQVRATSEESRANIPQEREYPCRSVWDGDAVGRKESRSASRAGQETDRGSAVREHEPRSCGRVLCGRSDRGTNLKAFAREGLAGDSQNFCDEL